MLPGLDRRSPAHPYRLAIELRLAGGAGQRKPAAAFKLNIYLAQRYLQRRGVSAVTHQQISGDQRRLIHSATAADAQLTQPFTPAVLHRGIHSGADNF